MTRLGYKLFKADNLELPPYILAPATKIGVFLRKPSAANISTASSGVKGHKPSDRRASGEGNLLEKKPIVNKSVTATFWEKQLKLMQIR